jgi:methanogenic corrinoid protein MtbC1
MEMAEVIEEIYTGVLEGDRNQVVEAVRQALAEQVGAESILKQGMMPAMAEVGRLFEEASILCRSCWWLPMPCRAAWTFSGRCW